MKTMMTIDSSMDWAKKSRSKYLKYLYNTSSSVTTDVPGEAKMAHETSIDDGLERAIALLTAARDGAIECVRKMQPEIDKEQRHCLSGTPERAYWHYGYAIALKDATRWLQRHATAAATPKASDT